MRTSPQVPIVSPQWAHLTSLSLVAWSGTMNLLLPQLRHLSGAGPGMALAVHSAQHCCLALARNLVFLGSDDEITDSLWAVIWGSQAWLVLAMRRLWVPLLNVADESGFTQNPVVGEIAMFRQQWQVLVSGSPTIRSEPANESQCEKTTPCSEPRWRSLRRGFRRRHERSAHRERPRRTGEPVEIFHPFGCDEGI